MFCYNQRKMKVSFEPERVDLVDASGIIQKRGVLRSQIHKYPELHLQIVIGVISNNSGEILVHKRAQKKKVNPGDIDHVCGGVMSGETPEQAVIRETEEETGLTPNNLKLVTKGLNSYNRYRFLYSGSAEGNPITDKSNAEWVKFIHPNDLNQGLETGQMSYVDEFFKDTELVLNFK